MIYKCTCIFKITCLEVHPFWKKGLQNLSIHVACAACTQKVRKYTCTYVLCIGTIMGFVWYRKRHTFWIFHRRNGSKWSSFVWMKCTFLSARQVKICTLGTGNKTLTPDTNLGRKQQLRPLDQPQLSQHHTTLYLLTEVQVNTGHMLSANNDK